jgi:hypothetical protein
VAFVTDCDLVARERTAHVALLEARREVARLREQNEQLVASNGDLSRLLLASEQRNGEAIKVIVALRRLMEAGTAEDALRSLEEILINVVGTEDFVVLALHEDTLVPIAGIGGAVEHSRQYPPSRTVIMDCLSHHQGVASIRWHGEDVAACIPLRIDSRIVGAIAIANVLPHRGMLNVYDDEVLHLLSKFAASAILTAGHRSRWTHLPIPNAR